MGYSIVFYINTNCNVINTPATLADLDTFATSKVTKSDCDILSCRNLSSFRVSASLSEIENADYCYVSGGSDSAVFAINGIVPTSPDVCEVFVTIDYWLTAGGITNTAFLDGIVERHHVALADDVFGAFTEEDPYMIPSKPLEIDDAGVVLKYSGVDKSYIEASLHIGTMGGSSALNAYTYTDPNTNETVTVPRTVPLGSTDRTVVSMNIPAGSPVSLGTPVTAYFDATNSTAMAGLAKCRDLGCEGAILNSWTLPHDVIASENDNPSGLISSISSQTRQASSGLNFIYGTANNKRVFYGPHNRYVAQAVASGNKGEYNPEDIYHSGDIAPSIVAASDPRPSGKPYFRFQYYLGSTDFWINCIPGLEWQNAPFVYQNKTGRTIDRVTFFSERANAAEIRGFDIAQSGLNMAMNAGNNVVSGLSNADTPEGLVGGLIAGGTSAVTGLVKEGVNLGVEQVKYNIARENELRRFNISQTVVTPQIEYPREESLRDFLGNGCRVYRYKYSASDLVKIDNILSAYGYKDTTLISPTHFTNRSKFNYIKASGISVNNSNIPKWIRDGMAMQLSVGIRVWHVKPSATYYADGSNT